MMGCDNSDYSYVTKFPGPGVTEVLEEPVEEESEGEVRNIMGVHVVVRREGRFHDRLPCYSVNWSERGVIN